MMPPRRVRADREVWIHIDRFDKPRGDVWAVQYIGRLGKPVYRTARSVVISKGVRGITKAYQGRGSRQPRALLEFYPARVVWISRLAAYVMAAEP